VSVFGGGIDYTNRGDKGLSIGLMQLFKLAWADPDLRQRILFVLWMFAVFTLGVHIQVPIPGLRAGAMDDIMQHNDFLNLLNSFGGGALKRVSIFSLGLNPYITASIILQVLTQANPAWKQEMKEGGEFARKQQNKRTRLLSLGLCIVQSLAFLRMLETAFLGSNAISQPWGIGIKVAVTIFWTAGAMFQLWLGEQISEKGIGNGVSLMIFAGIIIALPTTFSIISNDIHQGITQWYQVALLALIFVATTWVVVLFTTAQRRIPIQTSRRQVGHRSLGGQTSYLPLSVSTAGVIPIIFAVSLLFLPAQFAGYFPSGPIHDNLLKLSEWLSPIGANGKWIVGSLVYTAMIFGFSYFYTAIQYNVEDMADHLKRANAFIPGVRPGNKTKEFLDGVISRVTIVGAAFLAVVALTQYWGPAAVHIQRMSIIGGTTLLIVVQVALETMKQIEANILMKQYGS
jgi:preprotein translocase subunit SecY